MPSHEELGSDFVSIVVADSTRIHTQLLADALRNDRGLQVVAAASNSEELLATVTRVPIDVVVISHNLDNQPGHGTEVLREMRALRPQIKGVILLESSKPQEVLECFRAGARGIFSKQERLESLCKCIRSVHEGQIWRVASIWIMRLMPLPTLRSSVPPITKELNCFPRANARSSSTWPEACQTARLRTLSTSARIPSKTICSAFLTNWVSRAAPNCFI